MSQWPSVAVAFSGGVDSVVVAKAAVETMGDRAVAVTAVSPSLAVSERKMAAEVATAIGIRHVEVFTNEFSNDDYAANRSDRCYFCKQTLYEAMAGRLAEWNVEVIANGTNLDDSSDHRPGLQAAADFRVLSPLAELKFTKADVRAIAAYWELSVADKPASPCLSSRIAYGVQVTPQKVQMIDRAEQAIRDLTEIREFRVRLEADLLARIEVPVSNLPDFLQADVRDQVITELKSIGFQTVTLDLEGFRSGRFNERLTEVELQLPK